MSAVGIGVDIVDVGRVAALLQRHGGRFLDRCFRTGEIDGDRVDLAAHVAGRWALKEACLKAIGGPVGGIPYRDIEVVRSPAGAPGIRLHGTAAAALAAVGGGRVLASLSHERNLAVGFVIVDRGGA